MESNFFAILSVMILYVFPNSLLRHVVGTERHTFEKRKASEWHVSCSEWQMRIDSITFKRLIKYYGIHLGTRNMQIAGTSQYET